MTLRLPQDIIGEVIGHLEARDVKTLSACGVVSSLFRRLSQKRLFHSVVLEEPANNVRLHRALSLNPTLASYIRSITVTMIDVIRNVDVDAACGVLLCVLEHDRAQELVLSSQPGVYDCPGMWRHVPVRLKTCLLDLLCRTSCSRLILRGEVFFPAEHLRELSHLRHLELSCGNAVDTYRVTPSRASHEQPGVGVRENLQSLTLRSPQAIQRILQVLPRRPRALLSLSHLRHLNLEAMPQASTEVQKFLGLVKDRLQTMSLEIDLDHSGNYLDFSLLDRLRILRVHRQNGLWEQGHWLDRVLLTLPLVTELEIKTKLSLPGGIALSFRELREIDTLLAQDRHAETLRSVILNLYWEIEENKKLASRCMPKLVKRGILVVR